MATQTTIVCDICGNHKKETNHWIIGQKSASSIRFTYYRIVKQPSYQVIDLCGSSCAHSALDKWIQGNECKVK
jgi:hypothetical protein